jgi:hypothetical protein
VKKAYINKNFSASTLATIDQANVIIDDYLADGLNLTLRQLYYQFVARDLFENKQLNYDRLGRIVSDARLTGHIDWDAIVDRTRKLEKNPHWTSVRSILMGAAQGYRRDVWADQPFRVEVWIEKQALTGIIMRPCEELDVPYFACRGYVSQSEQREAGMRALRNWDRHDQQTIVLHLGDHDPSGMDMTRDNDDRLAMFTAGDEGFASLVEMRRIALNMDQIRKYAPPPNPTKLTDSRAPAYISDHGYDSWELDALEPRVLDALIRDHIAGIVDDDLMEQSVAIQESERHTIMRLANEH